LCIAPSLTVAWTLRDALREELKQYEMAGDVYLQLGLEDQAHAAFKKAVGQRLDQQNFTDAARIEEHKLNDIEATLTVLEQGWPATAQANLCIQAIFRVLSTAGRHGESKAWIARVQDEFEVVASQRDVLTTVAGLANQYPDQATRELAHESTFQIVATELTDRPELGRAFLNSISELHPEDKLLSRDCSRFRLQLGKPTMRPKSRGNVPTLVTTFSLPAKVEWTEGVNLGRGYLLVGQKNQHVTILKLSADFKELGKQTGRLSNSSPADFSIAKTLGNRRVIVHCPLDDRFGDKEIFATDEDTQATVVGSSWIDHGTIGITQGQNHQWFVIRLTEANDCLLEILSSTGALMSSKPLPFGLNELRIPVPICFVGSKTHIAIGKNLASVDVSGRFEKIEFAAPIRSIRGTVGGTMPRVALAFDNGVQVLWNKDELDSRPMICSNMCV